MSDIKRRFSFASSALGDDAFEVISFTGTEGLSTLYRFEITIVSENDDIDLENVIHSRAKLKILRDKGDIVFNGILSTFEQLETAHGRTRYRAVLTPAFWRQTLTHHNQIFLDKTFPQIIEAAMKDGGLSSLDYEFRLTGQYEQHEYICQYGESHYSFVSRLMEREGIYFYFEQGESSEKIIVTDTALLHTAMETGVKVYYSQPSGLDEAYRDEVIKTVVCSQKVLPARVLLKDYNYRKPSLELSSEAKVSDRGIGDVFIYGEHFSTPEEGNRLAKVRADELKCRARTYQGESLIPYLRPGYLFELAGHNRKDFNITYLTTDISHSGDQSFMLNAGLGQTASDHETSTCYRNTFSAISSEVQFRPERTTCKPRISGTINAHIDAEGNGKYAEVDSEGRYKVRLPFDMSGSKDGKGSSWLRMAQPYTADGNETGMHFPLHKGTEVLLTFIDGDPDRPIIASAVPNPHSPSPINETNSTQNRLKSAGGNELHMEDQEGKKRILMRSPTHNSWVRIGAPNDPPPPPPPDDKKGEEGDGGIKISSTGGLDIEASTEHKIIFGEQTEFLIGSRNDVLIGDETSVKAATSLEYILGLNGEATKGTKIEYGTGEVYTNYAENELTGNTCLVLRAYGAAPPVLTAMNILLVIAAVKAVTTGLMQQYWLPGIEDKTEKKVFATLEPVVMAALSLVAAYVTDKQLKKVAEEITFNSSITMDRGGIKGKVNLGNIENKVSIGNVTNVVTASGNIENQVDIFGQITNEIKGGGSLTNKVTTGNIYNKSTLGHINNMAGVGIENVVTNPGGQISNRANSGSIQNDALKCSMKGTQSVALESGGNFTIKSTARMGVDGGLRLRLKAAGTINMECNDVKINGQVIQMG